jgi:flagellar basal body-associated protein FliL
MVENDENIGLGMESKSMRILLMIVTVLLLFAGPTYVPYLLSSVLNLGSVASIGAGLTLFVTGILLMTFLVRKKIIT